MGSFPSEKESIGTLGGGGVGKLNLLVFVSWLLNVAFVNHSQ